MAWIAAAALVTSTAGAVPSTARDGWAIARADNPGRLIDQLLGVVRISPVDGWAVGMYIRAIGRPRRALIERWDGAAWHAVDAPKPAKANAELIGVGASGSGDVWAVGDQWAENSTRARSLIEHFDGSAWNVVASPNPGAIVALSGVDASSPIDAWAVGSAGNRNFVTRANLAVHWDGSTWTVVPTPNVSDYSELTAVEEISPTDVWAVGDYDVRRGSRRRSLIEHWDGTMWRVVDHPVTKPNDQLTAVSASSANDVWAIGGTHSRNASAPIAEHWDGTSWSVVPTPHANWTDNLSGVSAVLSNAAWAVGVVLHANLTYGTLVERWDGVSWKRVPSPSPPGQAFVQLFAVAADPRGAFAVGSWDRRDGTSRALIESCCG